MSNKKNNRGGAIVRLVIWSVVLLILVAILVLGLIFKNGFILDGVISFSFLPSYTYENASKYIAGNTSFLDEVKNLDIEWTSGELKIFVYDGDEVMLEESGAGDHDENKMRTYLSDGTLHVRYAKSGIRLFGNIPVKDLIIYLPEKYALALDRVNIKIVSADMDTEGKMVCRELDVESVSGKINLDEIYAANAEMETVSGNITARGEITDIDVDSVSAKLNLILTSTPRSLEAESVSGNIEITLPRSGNGFHAKLDSTSGDMSVDGEDVGRIYKHGNCAASFNFDTVSGDVKIDLQ